MVLGMGSTFHAGSNDYVGRGGEWETSHVKKKGVKHSLSGREDQCWGTVVKITRSRASHSVGLK